MKETFYERIGEAVCRERLTNGLEVCVVPKPGYAKKYAFFSTRYGGMDTRFCLDGQWLNNFLCTSVNAFRYVTAYV